MIRGRPSPFLLLASAALGSACTDAAGPRLTSIAVSPPTAALALGDTARLTAVGLSATGDTIRGLAVTWTSVDTLVATVSDSGVVVGRGPGSTAIVATSASIQGVAGIAVSFHVAAIAAGFDHDCALTADGTGYCWGANSFGQLGDGTIAPRTVPTPVAGGHRFLVLTAGDYYTCGLAADSLAWCWGFNYRGQLGIGTPDTLPHPLPVAVAGAHHFRQLQTSRRTCGVTAQGEGYCWGSNEFGALGTGAPLDSFVPTPAPVSGGLTFTAISTSYAHSCGVSPGGSAHCWGVNGEGELGAVTDTPFTTPVAVGDSLSLSGLTASGAQACALEAGGGAAVCWGMMEVGEGFWYRRNPVRLAPGLTFTRIDVDFSDACGLAPGGAAWCWGSNWSGELGDGTSLPRYPPVLVSGNHTFVDITVGGYFACALDVGGAAYCWGDNTSGQLGTGTVGSFDPVPAATTGGLAFTSIVAGESHACGIAADSTAWCWGSNHNGQLGDSSTTTRSQPVLVSGGLRFVALTAALTHTCGLTSGGTAYCWGNGASGQLGTGSAISSSIPVPVAGGLTFARIAGAGLFACGIASGGTAYCWGDNGTGELGRGDTASSTTPVPVTGGLTFTDIAAGYDFACGRATAGTVSCWGSNTEASMGQGYLGFESPRPLPVQGGVVLASVATGLAHTCGLTTDGTAWCWGRNREGEIGTGDSVSSATPRPVVGGLHFVQLALGYEDSCGLTAAGALYCWGQKGPPLPTRLEPSTTFLTISSVFSYPRLCGVRADSTVFCPIRSGLASDAAPIVSGRTRTQPGSIGPSWRHR